MVSAKSRAPAPATIRFDDVQLAFIYLIAAPWRSPRTLLQREYHSVGREGVTHLRRGFHILPRQGQADLAGAAQALRDEHVHLVQACIGPLFVGVLHLRVCIAGARRDLRRNVRQRRPMTNTGFRKVRSLRYRDCPNRAVPCMCPRCIRAQTYLPELSVSQRIRPAGADTRANRNGGCGAWPLANEVYKPGETGATSTLPVVTVPSPLVRLNGRTGRRIARHQVVHLVRRHRVYGHLKARVSAVHQRDSSAAQPGGKIRRGNALIG